MDIRAFLGDIVVSAALLMLSSILNGYVLSVLWGWFVVPVFHLPQLSIVLAICIAMVVGRTRTTGEKIGHGTIFAILNPLTTLFFGWIMHLFM